MNFFDAPRLSAKLSAVAASLFLVTGMLTSGAALADYSEVSRMMRSGQLAEALAKADQFLSGKPKDPQMRFLKGVILTEQGKPQDAISIFTKLIEDYPELPEPYNNLAVLYAAQNQFDKARAALEMAIRTNPSYATAHENLGDVYAKLASQAYSRALQLDSSNTGVQPKLALIRELFAPGAKGQRPVAATPAAAASVPSVAAAAAAAKPAAVAAAPAAATPATPAAPAASAAPAAVPAQAATEDDVRSAVQAWANAWSRRDMTAYFSAYSKDFAAPGGRSKWEADRRARILGKSKISVQVSNLDIKIDGNKAQARFRQDYDADNLSINSRKTLDFVREGNRWLIVREQAG